MTNDQFKLLVYGTALLGVVLAEGKIGTWGQDSSLHTPLPATASSSWWQQSNQHIKPQDSPWLWLDAKPHARQVAQKNQNQSEETAAAAQSPQLQPVREEDKVYNETSPSERIEMMEKMRQFRLEKQEEQFIPVRL